MENLFVVGFFTLILFMCNRERVSQSGALAVRGILFAILFLFVCLGRIASQVKESARCGFPPADLVRVYLEKTSCQESVFDLTAPFPADFFVHKCERDQVRDQLFAWLMLCSLILFVCVFEESISVISRLLRYCLSCHSCLCVFVGLY